MEDRQLQNRGKDMVEISVVYEGDLHCKVMHGPSGASFTTDAPKDNQGKGESFSPTDLVATALGGCMATIMGIAARNLQLDIRGTKVTVRKEMQNSPVRRIASLTVHIHVPAKVTIAQKQKLIDAARSCPVHKSLHPDVATPIEFTWEQV